MEGLAWADVVKIAAGSGVVAAVVSFGLGWLKDILQRKEERNLGAQFDAIHLITKLDVLAAECASNYREFEKTWGQIQESADVADYSGGFLGCVKPEITIDSSSLSKIDRSIACHIAWLENDMSLVRDSFYEIREMHLNPDEAVESYADLVGYYGYIALLISRKLRKKYSLTSSRPNWRAAENAVLLKACSKRTKKLFKIHS